MRTIRFDKNIPQAILVQGIQKIWPGVVFSSLSPTRLREIPDPPLPGPKWVRVQNRLCGICASDLHLLLLEIDPKVAPAAFEGQTQFFPGHEVLGIVKETGEGVVGLKKGDRVVMDSRAVMKPTCFSRELDDVCRHCQEGNFQLCENAYPEAGDKGIGGGWGDSFIAHETELYKVPDYINDESAMMIEP
jgi:threonine dehydrogenase-like Zn-dependent dehydrogenase